MLRQVLKETTYFVLTATLRETEIFFRPLERLSKVEKPTLRGRYQQFTGREKTFDLTKIE